MGRRGDPHRVDYREIRFGTVTANYNSGRVWVRSHHAKVICLFIREPPRRVRLSQSSQVCVLEAELTRLWRELGTGFIFYMQCNGQALNKSFADTGEVYSSANNKLLRNYTMSSGSFNCLEGMTRA